MLGSRKLYGTFAILFLLILLVGCGGKEAGDLNVFLGGKVIEKDDKINIEGESNLLEGARVTGEVFVNEDELFSDTSEIVDNKGNFTMEMEHPVYGEAEVVVSFDFEGMQEEEIVEHYGENGKKLEGPYTYLTDHWEPEDIRREARAVLVLHEDNEEKKHEFSEPEWEEQPEDYGDPRAWIEIDDVTNDEEFFYIKGRSNLLEGTALTAYHSHNAETRVNPDGTFNFKLEYKYEEDEPIIVRFRPSNQWGSIQKHYGEHGEELVGNLVVQDGDYLYLEYPIEYEE